MKEVSTCLHPYFIVRDEQSPQYGLIFTRDRCVVPMILCTRIKEQLPGAHTGMQSCLRGARETVYWPGMNADLNDHLSKCDVFTLISQTKHESLSSVMKSLIDLGKRLTQTFSLQMAQIISVWLTTIRVTSNWIDQKAGPQREQPKNFVSSFQFTESKMS